MNGVLVESDVTVTDDQGKRWTITVQAASLYRAVFAYNAEQVCGSHRHYPKLERSTVVDVKTPDGQVFRTTGGSAWDWANGKG